MNTTQLKRDVAHLRIGLLFMGFSIAMASIIEPTHLTVLRPLMACWGIAMLFHFVTSKDFR